jgi:hypothetical protein
MWIRIRIQVVIKRDQGSHQCLSLWIRIRIQVATIAGSTEPMPYYVDPDPGSHQCGIQGATNGCLCGLWIVDSDPGSHQCGILGATNACLCGSGATNAGSREPPMNVYVDPDPVSHLCGIQGATNAYICVEPDQVELLHFFSLQ